MNVIFPDYIQGASSYHKRPGFSTLIKTAATRKEYRGTYWPASPQWEIEFPYQYLSEADMAALAGFIALVRGSLSDFYFRDLKNEVVGQVLTPVDEEGCQYQLSRVWNYWYTEYPQFPPFVTGYGEGGQDYQGQGFGVPIWETPYLFLDGIEVDTGYDISPSGLVTFVTSQTGKAVTANFGFYDKCRFKEDQPVDLEAMLGLKRWNTNSGLILLTVD